MDSNQVSSIVEFREAVYSVQVKNGIGFTNPVIQRFPNSFFFMSLKAAMLEGKTKCNRSPCICTDMRKREFADVVHVVHEEQKFQKFTDRLIQLDQAANECEQHLMSLFKASIKDSSDDSFMNQQKIAERLYNLDKEERFLLWIGCSSLLQVLFCNGGDELLSSVDFLFKKYIEPKESTESVPEAELEPEVSETVSKALTEPEGALLYVSLMEQQGKYNDALQYLNGLRYLDFRVKGRLLARLGDYDNAAKVFMEVLKRCPDDWDCFLRYLSCLLEDDSMWCAGTTHDQVCSSKLINRKLSPLSGELFDSRILDATKFVEEFIPVVHGNDIARCSHLAFFEIESRKILQGRSNDDNLLRGLLKYFERVGHQPWFTLVVEVFLRNLTHAKKKVLAFSYMRNCSVESNQTKKYCKMANILKIKELIGVSNNAVTIVKFYTQNLTLSKDLQEDMHGEELLIMASNVLVKSFWRTRKLGYLLEAILVLEFGMTVAVGRTRYMSGCKILLVHLYFHLGAFPQAYDWYKKLDIKYILLETLLHHILPQMLSSSPFWQHSTELLKEYISGMEYLLVESEDLTVLGYCSQNFSKVIEFVQFRRRLQNSHMHLMAESEHLILQVKQSANDVRGLKVVLQNSKADKPLEVPSIEEKCKSLALNEDLQTRPWWTPSPAINHLLEPYKKGFIFSAHGEESEDHWQEQSNREREAHTRKTIMRRSLIPRLIFLSTESALILKEDPEDRSFDNKKHNIEFSSLLQHFAESLGSTYIGAIIAVNKTVEDNFQELELVSSLDIVDWMNFAVFRNALNLSSKEDKVSYSWKTVDRVMKFCIEKELRSLELRHLGLVLSRLTRMTTEPIGWHILVIEECVNAILPFVRKKRKNSDKKLDTPLTGAILDSLETLGGVIKNIIHGLEEYLNENTSLPHLEQVFKVLTSSSVDWSAPEVTQEMMKSQRKTIAELLNICKGKLQRVLHLKKQMSLFGMVKEPPHPP